VDSSVVLAEQTIWAAEANASVGAVPLHAERANPARPTARNFAAVTAMFDTAPATAKP